MFSICLWLKVSVDLSYFNVPSFCSEMLEKIKKKYISLKLCIGWLNHAIINIRKDKKKK